MIPFGFKLREAFHLLLLRFLAESLSHRAYALKGGGCLRFFHRSPRLSEDLDFDVAGISVTTFRSKVRKILLMKPLVEALQREGLSRLTYSEPKQTETTQRWKIHLTFRDGGTLFTRLECSRRKQNLSGMERGVPSPELLSEHQVTPFVCSYYGAGAIAVQKVEALASQSRAACRDLFDLHHLLKHTKIERDILKEVPTEVRSEAVSKVESFQPRDFREQVAPFLPPEWEGLYRDSQAFEEMKREVRVLVEEP